MKPEYTVFVCQNVRPASHREGCCHARGGPEVLAAFRERVAAAGLTAWVDLRPSGCLDACPHGPVAVVYEGRGMSKPPGKLARLWKRGVRYGGLVPRDVAAIVDLHLGAGDANAPQLKRCQF